MIRERAQEIADSLLAGGMFPCHKTTASGSAPAGTQEQWCAGALGTMDKDDDLAAGAMSNQMARVCARLGLIGDPAELDGLDDLYDGLQDWVDVHRWFLGATA